MADNDVQVFTFVQACNIYTTASFTDRFKLGAWTALSGFGLFAVTLGQELIRYSRNVHPLPTKRDTTFAAILTVAAGVIFSACLAIPRRPEIFKNGKVVDREFTVSLANRFTFSWATPVLEYATKNRKLTHDDLPVVNHSIRAFQLTERFDAVGKCDKLWKQIFYSHWRAFTAQWTLQTLTAFTNFLPQIALFSVLTLLEARENGKSNQFLLWLVAIGMGLADGLSMWLESLMFYVCFLKLGIPVYEQLSAVIFAKAIRKKDVKSAAKVDQDAEINGEIGNTKRLTPSDEETVVATSEDTEKDDNDDEEVTKTKQSTINLIGVDSKRVSDFCTYQYLFLGSALKLAISVVFLTRLVGWIPMLSAFAVPILISPLNYFFSKKYSHAQDELMKYRDQKMAVVTEALQGIRQIKFSALENDWYERILKTRRKELQQQWKSFLLDTGLISIWIFGPALMSAVALASYAWINGTLSASVAFTTLSVFDAIEMTLAVIPEMVTEMIDAIVSSRRIQEFLDSAERSKVSEPGENISFQNATISWPSDEKEEQDRTFHLQNLNLDFQMGELNVISGRTGSGKSLLLSAIIGEADLLEGKLIVPQAPSEHDRFDSKANKGSWIIPESIAYVSQIPWIENATLRDNILFGLPYDDQRYQSVLTASALEKDLEMLQDGDLTDIGANGINLSGGQKWRTTFARALYSRAGILVLDDIFSAVDAHVGRQLYENALTGDLCKDRTRILVTHHVALCLPKTKYMVVLEDGHALHAGSVEQLRAEGHLSQILESDVQTQEEDDNAEVEDAVVIDDGGHALTKTATNLSQRSRRMSSMSQHDRQGLVRQASKISTIVENAESTVKQQPKKFTEDENREIGAMSLEVYKTYIKACRGYVYWCCLGTVFLSWIGIFLGRSYWVSYWTRQYDTESAGQVVYMQVQKTSWHEVAQRKYHTLKSDKQANDTLFYMGVYLGLSVVAWMVGTVRYLTVYFASIRGSRVMFEKLCNTILRAPLRFLDTTPVGRISNRFTADFNNIDSRMANDLGFMLHCTITVVSVVIAGSFVSPIMILFAAILLLFCGYFAKRFVRGAREIKRLESNAKSPIFEQFGSVLTGIATIRAFDRTEAYLERMYAKINIHCACYWHVYLFSRWMSFRANMVGAVFTFATAALIVSLAGIDAALAGFALKYSLELSESVIWMLRQYANVELNFNAVERVIEYSNLETEDQGGENAPAAWPTSGEIEVDDLVVSYAADLSPVLKNLTFNVKSNERVGVIGRTGAGKSSLTLALFRFLEAASGSIRIDGVDISKIKLYDLRSRLAIIPQDPVLFSGTVRSNLDPFEQHTDAELRDALARVHLLDLASTTASGAATPVRRIAEVQNEALNTGTSTPVNKNTALSLNTRISESGLNLSQGQRQLLCLARAIVSRPRILVLDEATSSVDMETDRLIQQSIREEFGGRCTLIVIAHRLSTIVDFERVLVLGQGQVVEYGTPKELYEVEDVKEGSFKEMVQRSGEKAMLEDVIFGKAR